MIHKERAKVLELLEDIEEAKQQTNTIQTSTNPYQNLIPNHTLKELSDRISTLTEEQKEFVDYAEEMIADSQQVLAFINADAGTGKTYTMDTFMARLLLQNKQAAHFIQISN